MSVVQMLVVVNSYYEGMNDNFIYTWLKNISLT